MMKHTKYKKFETAILENGLKILVFPQKHLHSVSVLAMIRAGHTSENVKNNGISHLIEHMLFDGTEKYPSYKELIEFFNTTSGELSGQTGFESISIGGTFVDEEVKQALSALQQIIYHPLLKEEFLEKEKSIILDELNTYEDSNDYKNFIESKRIRFKRESILSRPVGGTTESIQSLTHKDVRSFHTTFFVPNNICIIVVGNNHTNQVLKLIEKLFAKYPKKPVKHKHHSKNLFSDQRIKITSRKSKKAYIRISFPSYSWKSDILDRIGLSYVCDFLTNRRDSYLYSHLREELGWIYDISSDYLVGFDIGLFEIVTSTPIDKSMEVIKETLKTVHDMKRKLIDKNYFERIKDIDRKRLKMALDTPRSIVKWFSEELFYRYPNILLPEDIVQLFDAITPRHLARISQEIFNFEKINISVLQPFGKNEKNRYKEDILKYITDFT